MVVPDELAALDQWVIWKKRTRKGKTTKVPHRASDGGLASTTNPDDWCSLEDALAGQQQHRADGIGFVFSADDPYCGVDFDECFLEDGSMHPKAQEIIEAIGSYTELSPSGTGVHVILKAELGGSRRRTSKTPWGGNFEAYDQGRYFTFTGKRLNGLRIRETALTIDLLEDAPTGSTLDENWLDKARRNPKFVDLFDEGDLSDYNNDHSAADLALFNLLVDAIGDDKPRSVVLAFKGSALYRGDAKSGGEDYLYRTLERALSESDEVARTDRSSVKFEREVKKELTRIEVRQEARRRFASKNVPEDLGLPPHGWSLAEEIQLPRIEQVYRIQGLHPIGGNVLLVAAYKSGKTTLTLNLLRSLADNTPFLGAHEIDPFEGNIAVFNFEETPNQWLRHVEKLNIQNMHRVFTVHRRGQPILPIWEPDAQDRLVEWMIKNEIAYWIMDPTVVAWQGLVDNENDNALVAAFTSALDQVKLKAGIGELILTHHEGRLAEGRGRGATRLEDWMDAGWYLSRDDATNQRTLWAKGRDVEVERFDLKWDESQWMLSAGETMTEQEKFEKIQDYKLAKEVAVSILMDEGPLSLTKLTTRIHNAGVGLSIAEIKKRLDHWAHSADSNLSLSKQVTQGRKQYTFYLDGVHEDVSVRGEE